MESGQEIGRHPITNAVESHDMEKPAHRDENPSIADKPEVNKTDRVLCWVMTQPKNNHKMNAQQVKATWGKQCNKIIFISTKADESLPVKLPVNEEIIRDVPSSSTRTPGQDEPRPIASAVANHSTEEPAHRDESLPAENLPVNEGFNQDVASSTSRESGQDIEGHPIVKAVVSHGMDEPAHRDEDRSVADELFKTVRVLCWVMTDPNNHKKRAQPVKATWGKRCNKLIFMSTETDESLPTVKLPVKEGRNWLWGKTKEAFRYVYEHHQSDADWFLKADDDTYVVVENLRYMLSKYDPKDPIYFGCRFKPFTKQGYMSGGAGYVLSREALDRFVNKALPSPHLCKVDGHGAEDAEIGKCLDGVGVKAMDSRDSLHRGRFFPFVPRDHLFPTRDKNFWYWKYLYYPTHEGLDCCSDHAVSFHYIKPKDMYVLDYLIYHLRPYGINYNKKAPSVANNTHIKEINIADNEIKNTSIKISHLGKI